MFDNNKAYPLFCKVFDDLKLDDTKISNKVYELLNEEQFNLILSDNKKEFWFEVGSFGKLPDYAYDYLIKYIKRNYGIDYLFNRLPY